MQTHAPSNPRTRIPPALTPFFFFVTLYAGPFLIPSPAVILSVAATLVAIVGMLLTDLGRRGLEGIHQFAPAAGALRFLMFLTPIQEFDKTGTDNPAGMGLVHLSFLVFLVLRHRIRQRPGPLRQPSFPNGL